MSRRSSRNSRSSGSTPVAVAPSGRLTRGNAGSLTPSGGMNGDANGMHGEPQDSAFDYVTRARQALAAGNADEGKALLMGALEMIGTDWSTMRNPNRATVLIDLAGVAQKEGPSGRSEAEKHLKEALDLRVKSFGAHSGPVACCYYSLGLLALENGDYKGAFKSLLRAAELFAPDGDEDENVSGNHPANPVHYRLALEALSSLLSATGNWKESAEVLVALGESTQAAAARNERVDALNAASRVEAAVYVAQQEEGSWDDVVIAAHQAASLGSSPSVAEMQGVASLALNNAAVGGAMALEAAAAGASLKESIEPATVDQWFKAAALAATGLNTAAVASNHALALSADIMKQGTDTAAMSALMTTATEGYSNLPDEHPRKAQLSALN